MASQLNLTGGCLCGAVRFRLEGAPFDAGWCHCRTCQLNSGSPAMVFATVPFADYVFEAGEAAVKRVKSSSFGHRAFCGECGTPLYTHVEHQQDTLDFSVTTLDEAGRVRPGFHIFWSSRVPWQRMDDGLPKYDRFRPNTVGFEGTEPPA
jgi:hypothetical protein